MFLRDYIKLITKRKRKMNKTPLVLFLSAFCISVHAVEGVSSISQTSIPPENNMQQFLSNGETYTYIRILMQLHPGSGVGLVIQPMIMRLLTVIGILAPF
jgi:hypothetical protein